MTQQVYTDNELTPENLRKLRKKLKRTQSAFGAAIGVDGVTVSRWENTKSSPSNKMVRRGLVKLMNTHLQEEGEYHD